MTTPRVAVVIVNYRTPDLAIEAIAALAGERAANPGLRVVVVDGGSGDGSAAKLAAALAAPRFAGWASLLPLKINGGFGWANNQAMLRLLQSADPPDFLHLLNPDTIVEPGAVTKLAETLVSHPECGAVGSLLLELDGTPSGSAFPFPSVRGEINRGAKMNALGTLLRAPRYEIEQPAGEADWVTGASVMFRSAALRAVGLFDTGFFLYFEEVELMWRIRAGGWSIRHAPASRVRHVGGAATGVNGSLPAAERPPLPAYWYQSRRRFLGLTHGRRGTLALSLAWLSGHGLLLARRLFGSGRQHPIVRGEASGVLGNGLLPSTRDRTPAITRWDDAPGALPAWRG